MVCCLTTPSYHQSQWRFVVNWTLRKKLRWNCKPNTNFWLQTMHLKISSVQWWLFCCISNSWSTAIMNYSANGHNNIGDEIDVPYQINHPDSFQSTRSSLSHRNMWLLTCLDFFDQQITTWLHWWDTLAGFTETEMMTWGRNVTMTFRFHGCE